MVILFATEICGTNAAAVAFFFSSFRVFKLITRKGNRAHFHNYGLLAGSFSYPCPELTPSLCELTKKAWWVWELNPGTCEDRRGI